MTVPGSRVPSPQSIVAVCASRTTGSVKPAVSTTGSKVNAARSGPAATTGGGLVPATGAVGKVSVDRLFPSRPTPSRVRNVGRTDDPATTNSVRPGPSAPTAVDVSRTHVTPTCSGN